MKKSSESDMPKKVLVITYYWIPAGGSGIQRWLHMTKYLPLFGWQPSIFAPENAHYQVYDQELAKEMLQGIDIYTCKLKDAAALYSRVFGKSKKHKIGQGMTTAGKKKSLVQQLAFWLRGNIFIPDPRVTWVRPSVKKIVRLIDKEHFDAIVTTGPPHSVHLIGKLVKAKTGILWLADFRDPWSKIDYLEQLSPGRRAMRIIRRLENDVLTSADVVVTIGKTLAGELKDLGAQRVEVVENGFDPQILEQKMAEANTKDFIISHTGVLPNSRNPQVLWEVLSEKVRNNAAFSERLKIVLAGKVDEGVIVNIEEKGLSNYLQVKGMVSHAEAIEIQQSSAVLLLVVNEAVNAKGIVTGKVFEYMANSRPILAIGPSDGDLSEILKKNNSQVYSYNDIAGVSSFIENVFGRWMSGDSVNTQYPHFMDYSREQLASKIAEILNKKIFE